MLHLSAAAYLSLSSERFIDLPSLMTPASPVQTHPVIKFLEEAKHVLSPYTLQSDTLLLETTKKFSLPHLAIYLDQTLYIFDLLYNQNKTQCDLFCVENFLFVFHNFENKLSLDNIGDALHHLSVIIAKQKLEYHTASYVFECLLLIPIDQRESVVRNFELLSYKPTNPTSLLTLLSIIHPRDRTSLIQKTLAADIPLEEQENYLSRISTQSQIEYFLLKAAVPKGQFPLFDKLSDLFFRQASR